MTSTGQSARRNSLNRGNEITQRTSRRHALLLSTIGITSQQRHVKNDHRRRIATGLPDPRSGPPNVIRRRIRDRNRSSNLHETRRRTCDPTARDTHCDPRPAASHRRCRSLAANSSNTSLYTLTQEHPASSPDAGRHVRIDSGGRQTPMRPSLRWYAIQHDRDVDTSACGF